MIHYSDIGLVNPVQMFKKAYEEQYAVPAYNFVNLEQLQGILTACMNTRSPVILQVSKNVRNYVGKELVRHMVRGAVELVGSAIPVALNLDHGDSLELCKDCIEDGFSSVMIDGSALPYKQNVELTREVVHYAGPHGVCVEGELGVLSGVEEYLNHGRSLYTDPDLAADFISKTGVDCLAVSIGTSHGIHKLKNGPAGGDALRFDILEEIGRKLPGFPIVLHGSSSLPREYVAMLNRSGGDLSGVSGIPEEQLRRAVKGAVCKVNVASDGWLIMTAVIRKILTENPAVFDPRKYLGPARDELEKIYERKNRDLFGSAGKA
jgi:fructose-bisphosphate aldolase class II